MITQSFSWGKHCSIHQVCLFLILALFVEARKCPWLPHWQHFLAALLSSWTVHLVALRGCLFPLLGISELPQGWFQTLLCLSWFFFFLHFCCSPTIFRTCLSNKIGWVREILAILAWNPSQVSIHTPTESCLHVIIEELCRSVCIQWCVVRRQAKLLRRRSLSGGNKTEVYFSLTE